MHSRLWAAVLVLFFAVLIVALIVNRSRPGQLVFDGVTYDIEAPSETLTFPAGGLTIQTPGHTLADTSGRLTVDGANYGRVGRGDRVTMRVSGAVTVNGKPRTPAP